MELNNKSRLETIEGQDKKIDTYERANALYEGRELTLNAFKSGIFLIKEKKRKRLIILTTKQMIQRLPTALAQVKAGTHLKIY